MSSCDCPHGRDIERFRAALDGNGKPGLWTRIAVIEAKLNIIITILAAIGVAVAAQIAAYLAGVGK